MESAHANFAHTANHIDCPACLAFKARIEAHTTITTRVFREAAPLWLEKHRDAIAAKTAYDYEYYIRSLGKFFDELRLDEIHIGHFQAYAEYRLETAGPSCINHELNTVKQILDYAGLWSELERFYQPLKLPKPSAGRAIEETDEDRLFAVAAKNPRWKVAYWCAILTATTTAGPSEISHLHLADIELGERPGAPFGTLHIRDGLKNGYRQRIVPLNASSRWAVGQLLKRYYKICRRLHLDPCDEHYILPGRARQSAYNPMKPMGSWKKAWRALRVTAGLPELRYYDLRHQAITKLMEDPDISEQTVEEMAGHALSSSMKRRYSHIRMKPKAEATAKLELTLGRKPVGSERVRNGTRCKSVH